MKSIGDPETRQRPNCFPGLRPGRPWFVSLVFLVLAFFVPPPQAAAQNSIVVAGSTITIANAAATEGGDSARFTVTAVPPPTGGFSFDVSYVAGSAGLEDLGSSRLIGPGALILVVGMGSKDLVVPIFDDDFVEGEETYTAVLGISGRTIRATGTITDNDEAVVSLDQDATGTEGGTITFTAELDNPVTEAFSLGWTAQSGTATVGEDLAEQSGTVTFEAESREATFTIRITDDLEDDDSETFTVSLSGAPTGLVNIAPSRITIDDDDNSATGTIIDNDEPPGLSTSIRIADAAPAMENGIARFTISLDPRALTGDAVLEVAYAPGTATEGTQPATPEEDLGSDRPATVTIPLGSRRVILEVPIADDEIIEGRESFTVTLSAAAEQPDNPETGMPPAFILLFPDAEATGTITDNDVPPEVLPPVSEPSVLIEPRRIGAAAALRRHAGRFDGLTGTVVRNRLKGSGMHDLSLSADVTGDRQDVAVSSQPFTGSWGTWIDGAWAGVRGNASGRQADIYGGVDYLGADGDWLVGALVGYELADLDVGEANFRSDTFQFGIYGGALLSDQLLFDGALTFGMATPEVAQGDVSASYDARRLTARGALTGDFGLGTGRGTGSVTVEPQLGLLYSRETLGAFTDSAGGLAEREVLELGRSSAGPRLTWNFDGGRVTGQVTGGARVQWDFLGLDDGVGGRLSGAADIGLRLDLAQGVTFGVRGDVDGIGILDDFRSLGGKVELGVRF